MNEKQFNRVMSDIIEVMGKMGLNPEKDESDNTFLFAHSAVCLDQFAPASLYVVVDKDRDNVMLNLEVSHEFSDDQLPAVVQLANMFNRQHIDGSFCVHMKERLLYHKKDIIIDRGKLNKSELRWTIKALFNDAGCYFSVIIEELSAKVRIKDRLKDHWAAISHLHRECCR